MAPNRIATALNRIFCAAKPGRLNKLCHRGAALGRRTWLRFGDPAVEIEWPPAGRLKAPLAHELAYIAARVPQYGLNLARVADALARATPGFAAIDIGANIGDTALLLRRHGAATVLAVEGAADFLRYLRVNAGNDPAIEIAETFVDARVDGGLAPRAERGSLHFAPAANGRETWGRPLATIVAEHPRFSAARLLKLDTDGFDLPILQASAPWIAQVRPVLFFEYLPFLFRPHRVDPGPVFDALAAAGYGPLLVWDNRGRFVAALSLLARDAAFWDVLQYFDGPDDGFYADLALFTTADAGLAAQIAANERGLTAGDRGAGARP